MAGDGTTDGCRAAAMAWQPSVSVVVPHFNDVAALELCLDRLCAQDYPAERFAIIVADNASPLPEGVLGRAIAGRATLVVEPRPGAGMARNAGVAQARGEVLAFIDSDCVADADWLSRGVAALAGAGFIGGAVSVIPPAGRPHNGVEAFEAVFAFDVARYVRQEGFAVTANLFVRSADFARIGGFVTGKSEDVEWCWRATAAGLSLSYAPGARVGHPPRRNWDELVRKWRRVSRELYLLTAEQPHGRARWLARSLAMPLSAVAHLPRMLTARDLTLGSRLRGTVVLVALRCWRMAEGVRLAVRPPR